MEDISVIILTYNEEKHIERCINLIKPLTSQIYLVDSYSTDQTLNIALRHGAKIYQNKWENNHAKQFNWGLQNLPIKTKWVLRLDADEYLLPELIQEIKQKIPTLSEDVSGIVFKRRHIFLGMWVKKGTYPVKLLRLFRNKKGICEQRWMDEHIQLLNGKSIEFEHDFVDHNLNGLHWWIQKHNGYAIREAIDLLDIELNLFHISTNQISQLGEQAVTKRHKKHHYTKLPLFLRSFMYFSYRYIFKLGFLEGKEGFLWNFFQGWWYRTLVDAKIYEIKKNCGSNKEAIKKYLKKEHDISI